MEGLLQKANVESKRLKDFITSITGEELSKISEPCYFPSHKKYFYELINMCKLDEKTIRSYFREFYKGVPAAEAQTRSDVGNCLLTFIMWYFLKKNDIIGFTHTMIFYMIRQYSNLMHKQFPQFCKPEVFKWTLDNMSKTHLFAREKTISSAIYFLSQEMIKKYQNDFRTANPEGIALFLSEGRTRLSQSIKSFAEVYYKASEEGLAYKTPYESEETPGEYFQSQERNKYQKTSEEVSKLICVYKRINKSSIEDAKKITRIHSELANLISTEICNIKYLDSVRLIIELFLKDTSNIKQVCGPMFLPYVKSLMSIKRTTKLIYFKQQVIELTEKVIENISYTKKYKSVTDQTRFLICAFTAYYITMISRYYICGSEAKIVVGSFRI